MEALWDAVRQYGAGLWAQQGQRPDGLAAWQPLKAALDGGSSGAWRADFVDTFRESASLRRLEEQERAAGPDDQLHADAHFYAQLLRIPTREECSARRVLQLAYNLGQLEGSGALARFGAADPAWLALFADHRLQELATYVTDPAALVLTADQHAALLSVLQQEKQ